MISSVRVLMETKIPKDLNDEHPLLDGVQRLPSSGSAINCKQATANSGVDDYIDSISLTNEDAIHKVNERLDRIEVMMVDLTLALKGSGQKSPSPSSIK
ncbi:hypothetical protein CYMTET_32331 [Cymbomonas tetramitiformis]|uniref:Uncharacterized protein n=1 Tax=Cymbomonas tetramitiformis TaxID=36881 RepID=A0AAE0KRY6_9CHLO|nr:hypothetical protein CYMTET_32331 [Cymbomonas tetramitiformis]